ncbi:MAG: hypothetical protein AB7G13_17860 [Lautropia sp.]
MHPTTRILVERRFPLALSATLASIRELYETGKRSRWNPQRDIDWPALRAAAAGFAAPAREAARSLWSRRAWLEYTGLAETPALLIRFCLEAGREADPKYFLTVRNTEEAWHVESFHLAADALGGYLTRPADPAWEPVINRTLYREALAAEHLLDDYVAVHCAVEDGLELELFEAYHRNARDPVLAAMLDRVVADKRRHAEFGWLYLESRLAEADAARRAAIAAAIADWIETVAFSGYQVATLSTTIDTAPDIAAMAAASDAGLGAVTAATEERVFTDYLQRARERLAGSGVAPRACRHPRLGPI